jgi:hypothetical protein
MESKEPKKKSTGEVLDRLSSEKEQASITGQDDKNPSAIDFCLNTPLYRKFHFKKGFQFFTLEYFKGTIDCHCHDCGRHSVFACKEKEYNEHGEHYENYLFRLLFFCTRDSRHQLYFVFRAHNGELEKIGQFPSLGDLASPDLLKYLPVLGNEKHRELIRGVGLASHDVGIGAFIYLRRVFEHLIESAHSKAKTEAGWVETVFEKSRMDEKIQSLKYFLPPFLVENRVLYKILSSGVHELSEQDCLKAFPAVKLGIELILDDELERHKREKKIEAGKKALNLTAQEIKQPKE